MTIKAQYDIYLNTQITGIVHAADCVIEEDGGVVTRVGFRYRLDYLQQPNAFAIDPVQLTLKASEIILPCQGGIPGFLDDYLPDAWGRKVLSKLAFYREQQRFNANSVIDTLKLMGTSRIGALSIVPTGQAPLYDKGATLAELEHAEFAAQQIEREDFSASNIDEIRMSLLYLTNSGTGVGGARPKALIYDQQTSYLAKFNRSNNDDYNNARVELACLKMAEAAGIRIGKGHVKSAINNREVLLLERFDIDENNHRCHLISINALLKTCESQRDIGQAFRYDDICSILQRYSINIKKDLQQLLTLMLFNRAIHNTDDHERNFSLINNGQGYFLSPAYDLVPSLVAGQYHAAGFNYSVFPPRPSEVGRLGKVFGLPKTTVAHCAEQVKAAIDSWPYFAEQAGVIEQECIKIGKVFCK